MPWYLRMVILHPRLVIYFAVNGDGPRHFWTKNHRGQIVTKCLNSIQAVCHQAQFESLECCCVTFAWWLDICWINRLSWCWQGFWKHESQACASKYKSRAFQNLRLYAVWSEPHRNMIGHCMRQHAFRLTLSPSHNFLWFAIRSLPDQRQISIATY